MFSLFIIWRKIISFKALWTEGHLLIVEKYSKGTTGIHCYMAPTEKFWHAQEIIYTTLSIQQRREKYSGCMPS
jgi:hypothetical protein